VITSYPYTVYFGDTVAVPWMVQLDPTAPFAVKRPLALITPHLAVQVTGWLAENYCVVPCGVFAETGVIKIGETTVTFAGALPLPSAAFAVTEQVVLGYKGALKSPVEEIDPHVVVQVDATLAVNCIVAYSCRVTDVGETVTAKAGKQQISRRKEHMECKKRFKIDLQWSNVGLPRQTFVCTVSGQQRLPSRGFAARIGGSANGLLIPLISYFDSF